MSMAVPTERAMAVQVEQRHAAGHAAGASERARVDGHGTAPEMVVPGHVPV